MQVAALFADTSWQDLLASRSEVVVESVFRRTLNLRARQNGKLYTLFFKDGYRAPRAMYVTPPAWEVQLSQSVRGQVADDGLRLPGLVVTVDDCQFTSSCLLKTGQPTGPSAAALRQWLEAHATAGSFYGPASDPVSREIVRRLDVARWRFLQAGDQDAARQLVGLGIGLTPSGDDYLVGYLAAIWHDQRHEKTKRAVQEVLLGDLSGTTAVSRLYLTEATAGNFAEPIQAVCKAVATNDIAAVEQAAEQLFNHGATSGQDILTGMCDAYNKFKEKL